MPSDKFLTACVMYFFSDVYSLGRSSSANRMLRTKRGEVSPTNVKILLFDQCARFRFAPLTNAVYPEMKGFQFPLQPQSDERTCDLSVSRWVQCLLPLIIIAEGP